MDLQDAAIRARAFEHLGELERVHGEVLPRTELAKGFRFRGETVRLLGPSGIFKPAQLGLPLSITTVPERPDRPRPYEDGMSPDGFLLYRYRGTNPDHRDNAGLRECMRRRMRLIYFHGVVPGRYVAVWPVTVIEDRPRDLSFLLSVEEAEGWQPIPSGVDEGQGRILRGYVTRTVFQRVHQRGFREKVLAAYRRCCSICRLRHEELLDAAHIIPDSDPRGQPVVRNGISLCKLHHAAFDANVIGIRPDCRVQVRRDVLEEEDGPMLLHGLQGVNGKELILPRSRTLWPDPAFLEERFGRFLRAM